MKHIVYNCGYYMTTQVRHPDSNTNYFFKRRFITEVADEDVEYILGLTSKDVQWCPTDPKHFPPFMKLKDWCEAKDGRFEKNNGEPKKYDIKEYLNLYLLHR